MALNILAFSSSRVGGGAYLEAVAPVIKRFLGDSPQTIAFLPFASVDGYDGYADKVREGLASLPHTINLVTANNAKDVIEQCDAIIIGGGNTFKLLHDLYEYGLMNLIRQKVQSGTPYIGWSAGSNLCGPTIRTTNDMPIIQPQSFEAFGFFPFQINPHYHNAVTPGFNGETRDQRLEEFLKLNGDKKVMALPEGTYLLQRHHQLLFDGVSQAVMMSREDNLTVHQIIEPGTVLQRES